MDIRQIRALVAVCEEGSFSKAARRLGFAQPTLSVLVRDLERDLGTPLFDRSARGAVPTAAGRALHRRAVRILREIEGARAELGVQARGPAGEVRIGLPPTVAAGLLPGILVRFTERYPAVSVRVAEGFTGTLTDWTVSGEVDCAVTAAAPADARLVARPLASEPILLVRAGPGAAQPAAPVRLSDGAPLKLVLPSPRHALRTVIDGAIRAGRIPVARSLEIDSLSAMLGFVAQSDWCTFLSPTAIAAGCAAGLLSAQPLAEPLPALDFHLVHRSSRALSPAAALFVEMIGEALGAGGLAPA